MPKSQEHLGKANKTKLRLIKYDKYERKEYLNTCSIKNVTKTMRYRLNMTKIKANYKGKCNDLTCDACKEEQETTEHIPNCKEYRRMFKWTKETQETKKIQQQNCYVSRNMQKK